MCSEASERIILNTNKVDLERERDRKRREGASDGEDFLFIVILPFLFVVQINYYCNYRVIIHCIVTKG